MSKTKDIRFDKLIANPFSATKSMRARCIEKVTLRLSRNLENAKAFNLTKNDKTMKSLVAWFSDLTKTNSTKFEEVDLNRYSKKYRFYEEDLYFYLTESTREDYYNIPGDWDQKIYRLSGIKRPPIYIEFCGMDNISIWISGSVDEISDLFRWIYQIERSLSLFFKFAYSETLGYLTSSPETVGTGLQVSLRASFPGLYLSGNLEDLRFTAESMSMMVVPDSMFGKELSNIDYKFINTQTLGVSEHEIFKRTLRFIDLISHAEIAARYKLMCEDPLKVLHVMNLAFSTIQASIFISELQAANMISILIFACDVGILPEFYAKKKQYTIPELHKLRSFCRAEVLFNVWKDLKLDDGFCKLIVNSDDAHNMKSHLLADILRCKLSIPSWNFKI